MSNILAAPHTLEQTGLAADVVEQLLIKTMYGGEASGIALSERMCLPFVVFEPIIEHARAERLIEVRGAIGTTASSYRYGLTDLGRDRARQYFEINQYVGPAPVPLAAYVDRMRRRRAGSCGRACWHRTSPA
jgi:hypothetical protein